MLHRTPDSLIFLPDQISLETNRASTLAFSGDTLLSLTSALAATSAQEPGRVDSVFPKHERLEFGGHVWTGHVRFALRVPVPHLPAKLAMSSLQFQMSS
jgi:hypothetical protein